jgi:hypothetical protein
MCEAAACINSPQTFEASKDGAATYTPDYPSIWRDDTIYLFKIRSTVRARVGFECDAFALCDNRDRSKEQSGPTSSRTRLPSRSRAFQDLGVTPFCPDTMQGTRLLRGPSTNIFREQNLSLSAFIRSQSRSLKHKSRRCFMDGSKPKPLLLSNLSSMHTICGELKQSTQSTAQSQNAGYAECRRSEEPSVSDMVRHRARPATRRHKRTSATANNNKSHSADLQHQSKLIVSQDKLLLHIRHHVHGPCDQHRAANRNCCGVLHRSSSGNASCKCHTEIEFCWWHRQDMFSWHNSTFWHNFTAKVSSTPRDRGCRAKPGSVGRRWHVQSQHGGEGYRVESSITSVCRALHMSLNCRRYLLSTSHSKCLTNIRFPALAPLLSNLFAPLTVKGRDRVY